MNRLAGQSLHKIVTTRGSALFTVALGTLAMGIVALGIVALGIVATGFVGVASGSHGEAHEVQYHGLQDDAADSQGSTDETGSDDTESDDTESDDTESDDTAGDQTQGDDEQQARYDSFEKLLSGAKLVGKFTILGQDSGDAHTEEYTIRRARKLDRGDLWLIEARVKYADKNYTVPLPLEVKWAGDTPMITLTDLTILGEGPFSARVIFYNNKYAGTWSHGDVGGHMFGSIERMESDVAPIDD